MKWTPGRILLHVIIVLVTLALPLLLPSSCGPAVHSEAGLTAESQTDPLPDHSNSSRRGQSSGGPRCPAV